MRFSRRDIAQDVVVSCCILHNIRKTYNERAKEYSENEYEIQRRISEDLHMYPHQRRLQDYLIQHYFN